MFVELPGEATPQPGVAVRQEVQNALVLGAEEKRSVLEDGIPEAPLRAADELPAGERHLVLRGAGEAGRGEVPPAGGGHGAAPGFETGIDAERADSGHQAAADGAVNVADAAADERVAGRADDGVGELVPVEDGAAAGGAPHDVDPEGAALLRVDFAADPLGVAEGDGRRIPAEDAKDRPGAALRHG